MPGSHVVMAKPAAAAGGGISFNLGHGSGSSKVAGTSLLVVCTGAVAVGQTVFVMFGADYVVGNPTCTDNLGNTYTVAHRVNNGTSCQAVILRSDVTVAGTLTLLTVSHPSLTARAAIVYSFNGCGAQRTTGGHTAASATCFATPGVTGSGTASGVVGELWLQMSCWETTLGTVNIATVVNAATGVEPVAENGTSGGGSTTNITVGSFYRIVPNTTAVRMAMAFAAGGTQTNAGAGIAVSAA
jgi:hypothetical protein